MTHPPYIQGALIGFVGTTDAERSKNFYVDRLGFTLVEDSTFALVLDANGSMIRVQKLGDFAPPAYTVLGWKVVDIKQTVAALAAQGVLLERFEGIPHDDLGIWRTPNGDQIGWLKDPEGQIISITEFR